MCDYSEYSIIALEHCVSMMRPYLAHDQFILFLKQNANRYDIAQCFRTGDTSWEFAIHHYSNTYGRYVCQIGIKNIHGPVNQSAEVNEPLAEIVIWHWKDNKQEIIKKVLFKSNETDGNIYSPTKDDDIYFTIRLIKKCKLAEDLCPPLDVSDAFTISVGDQNFVVSAHRLMQISPVFRAMLSNEMREKAERMVEVKDAEPEHFRAFLEVIDPDRNVQPNPLNIVEVLKLADRYQVNLAKDRCEDHLLNCVEMPLIERLRLVNIYGLNKLKDSILSIGSAKLRALYKANAHHFKKGQFSADLTHELTLRICEDE